MVTGSVKANSSVAQSLYKMATSGKCPASTMFWLKCRAGWRETSVIEHTGRNGGPLEMVHLDGKIQEELARVAASQDLAKDVAEAAKREQMKREEEARQMAQSNQKETGGKNA